MGFMSFVAVIVALNAMNRSTRSSSIYHKTLVLSAIFDNVRRVASENNSLYFFGQNTRDQERQLCYPFC